MAKTQRNKAQVSQRSGVIVPSLGTSASAVRFEKYIANLDKSIQEISPEVQLMLCALAYESLLSPSDFVSFLTASDKPILAGNTVLVSWVNDLGEVQRRVLSDRTQIALSRLSNAKKNWDLKLTELKLFLIQKYPDANRFRSSDLVQVVCTDSHAWNYHVLPKLCLGYLSGESDGKLLPIDRLSSFLDLQACSSAVCEAPSQIEIDSFENARAVYSDRFFDTEEPTFSAANLETILAIFSEENSGNSIRISEFRQRAQLIERVNAAALAISKTGSAVDAFLLGWAIYLINEGSLRLSNPTVRTICAYFRIAPSISRALSALRLRPIELTQEQWEEFFIELKQQSSGPALASLQSFHMFVVCHLGIDPVAHMCATANSASNIRASFVSESEFLQCLQIADSISLDERICSSVKAILTIGYSVPIRINEVQGLHICDIRVYPEIVEIHFSPKRSEARGKSIAARRTVKVSDPTLIKHLTGWLERRKKDLALDDDPLFGDPHGPGLYQFGLCVHLVNKILKSVCKDPEASFHDFRHAWATRNIVNLTDPTFPTELSIDELRVQMGHAPQSLTIIESYFHCHDIVVRRAVDAYLEKFDITSSAAAFWLEKKGDALRAGKSRSSQPDRYYRDEIQIAAEGIWQRPSSPAPATSGEKDLHSELNLLKVRKFLSDVQNGLSGSAVSSRCGLNKAALIKLITETFRSVSILRNSYPHLERMQRDEARDIDMQLQLLKAELSKLHVDLDLQVEPSLRSLYENLLSSRLDHHSLKDAVTGWTRIRHGKFWSLEKMADALPALKFLTAKGMDTTCLEIRYACDDPTDEYSVSCALESDTVKAAILQVKAIAPHMANPLAVIQKSGRPCVYVVFRRNSEQPPLGGLTDSARCRYGRVNGLMFSLLVMQTLNGSLMGIDE